MKTSYSSIVTGNIGTYTRILPASKGRIAVEFHIGNAGLTANFLYAGEPTVASRGLQVGPTKKCSFNDPTLRFTLEKHGDIVTRDWWIQGATSVRVLIIETFDLEP